MNKEYKIKLDLNKKLYNKKMIFNQFDENVNDFYIEITKNNEVVKDLDKSIITLVAIKPNGEVDAQFIEVKEGQIYADLKPSMCDLIGNYQAKAMIVLEGEIVTTDTINYSVNEDKIISKLNEDVVSDERFTLFTDALARLSTIETSEEQRMINEAERILSEENRKIEEAKRVEAELVRQHEEADRTKYDAIRESNENIRKQNESIRLSNETNRIDEEAKRVEEENKRKLAEEERNANYNFMTEDEERRRSEANDHKEAENLRVQAETNRVNEEAKRRTTEQARVSAENTRVSNENVREASEVTRKNNETQRVEAEIQRQSRYNSFIVDAEANANNFENYTNTAKVKEEERKSNELDRKSQETQRISNEVERISNENSRKANEVVREENEISRQGIFEDKVDEFNEKIVELNTTKENFVSSINTKVDNKISEIEVAKSDMTNTVSNKVNEVETRFNALTSSQQQDAEVIDARVDFKGVAFDSLKERIDYTDKLLRDSTVSTVTTESDFTTVEATSNGYFEDVKLEGKTLVNLCTNVYDQKHNSVIDNGNALNYTKHPQYAQCDFKLLQNLKQNTTYTVFLNVTNFVEDMRLQLNFYKYGDWVVCSNTEYIRAKGVHSILLTTTENIADHIRIGKMDSNVESMDEYITLSKDIIILEGDHTQNPPSYFEGLKSVGQSATTSEDGADEIVVSSVKGDGNLIDLNNAHSKYCTISSDSIVGTNEYNDVQFYVYLEKGAEYFFNSDGSHDITANIMYGMQKKYNASATLQSLKDLKTKPFTFIGDTGLYTLHIPGFRGIVKDIQLVKGAMPKPYTQHQSDKKRLLYYNNETQTWEKPILRQWDSIEKHANGKYYYHQRSGEVVLNGSENFGARGIVEARNTLDFYIDNLPNMFFDDFKCFGMCDKFQVYPNNNHALDVEKIWNSQYQLQISILKSKLSTQDVQGFKQWLQANNVTVVYQLAQEKVYECTNIDLITYSGETNYVVESGAIVPRTTLKVHNNISNVVSLLQKKVSLLESNVTSYMITQNRLMLASRYNADTVSFKVDVATLRNSFEYDNDLYELILNNVLVGKDNYNREYIENLIIFYWMDFVISDEMYSTLFEIIEEQHNPKIEEETPLI